MPENEFDIWFKALLVEATKSGYVDVATSFYAEDWENYYIEGYTPKQALEADESNF
jgi:hypothetical protein